MKLLLIGPYPSDPSKVERGVEAVTVNLVEGLKSIEGLDIQVLSFRGNGERAETVMINGILVHFLVPTRRFGNITFGLLDRYKTRKKIKELQPDIIHNQYHFTYPYLFKKPSLPIITTVHGITFKEAPYENERLDWLRKSLGIYLERIVLNNVDNVICVSNYVKESIFSMTKANLFIVENPLSMKYFAIENHEIPFRVLFVGALIKRKNILDLLKAVNLLRYTMQIDLHIVGFPEELYYYDILKGYVSEKGLEKNVKFLGPLSEDALIKEYEQCCLVVLPSFEESAGMVLQQAMAAGKPVVATRISGIPCIVTDKKTGFLAELGNVPELAEKIRLLLKNENLRRAMGQEGKREAADRFRPEYIAKKTYDIYRTILG